MKKQASKSLSILHNKNIESKQNNVIMIEAYSKVLLNKVLKKAHEYYSKAVSFGNSVTLFNLGLFYKKGRDVSKNYFKEMEYYRFICFI